MAGNVVVSGKGNLAAAVYTPAGQLLAQGNGRDNLTLPLSGFTGIAIVRATDAEGHTVVKKISVR